MTATRAKIPVGSAPWLVQERRHADELVAMDTEEFGYSVRNEMEWLNEHMADIFTTNNLNVANIFKTPGKLRGKTPRTARKRNVLGERAPLTDIFAPNAQTSTSPTKTQFYKQVTQLQNQSQQDENSAQNRQPTIAQAVQQQPARGKQAWDSGYHGLTDDEMEIGQHQAAVQIRTEAVESLQIEAPAAETVVDQRRATEETFVSAKSDLASRQSSKEDLSQDKSSTVADQHSQEVDIEMANAPVSQIPEVQTEDANAPAEDDAKMDDENVRSPSDASSPVKPLLRKSSFTFSSLPSREPLAQKKSIGARSSVLNQTRSSFLGRFTGGKSLGGQQGTEDEEDAMDVDLSPRPLLPREESETTRHHNHSTTQNLRDRITMLGQSRDIRTSKSIPNLNASTNQQLYPQISPPEKAEAETVRPVTAPVPVAKPTMPATDEDDEDDWIAPVVAPKSDLRPEISRTHTAESFDKVPAMVAAYTSPRKVSPSRPKLPSNHKKAVSSSAISSPAKSSTMASQGHPKPISVSNPSMPTGNESTTPSGSPRRGHLDGAVSATKAKLYSAFRSAKGIFASSAGVSAQARMEVLSPGPKKQSRPEEDYFGNGSEAVTYPQLAPPSRVPSGESTKSSGTASSEGRKTRSSSEREQKRKVEESRMQKMEDELEKIREKERKKATAAAVSKLQKSPSKESVRPEAPSRAESERSRTGTDPDSSDEMPPPPPPKSMLPTQSQRLREPRRIAKPTKESAPKAKPAPVTIRMHVPSQLGHRPGTAAGNASLASSTSDLPPPPPPKPTLTSKSSTASLHSSTSNHTLRGGNPSQTAKKALEAAAKKKEADAKAAQRKAERQREIEQRRAAKAEEDRKKQEEDRRRQEEEKRRVEEDRRAEQRRRQVEQQKREEAKRAAAERQERQAAEARRLEQERFEQQRLEQQQRMEQQRREQQRAQQEAFAYALKQDKAQASAAAPRSDLGGARPVSRVMHHDGRPTVQINPAKPKRALQEDEEQHHRPQLQRNPASYQQMEAKRRKTNEGDEEPMEQRRSVMAGPPVRQSNIRKIDNKFQHGYAPAPSAAQHGASMFIKTVTGQHQLMHGSKPNDMAKFANGHIPFAGGANAATAASSSANPHKTPGRQMPNGHGMKSAAKSSPHYPNPENIHLPDIATDSEDEDSENEFQAPSWTESPALRQLLTDQQLVDPQSVFGPIAPLRMEEVFRNKDRQKKFRDRTSSANWNGADRLTEEERQRDREARERLMRDGGWTFQPGL